MRIEDVVREKAHRCFWERNFNCAMTSVAVFSDLFPVNLDVQIFDAVIGMNGAGKFGAQCGIVEATLMLLGIIGRSKGLTKDEIMANCYEFASEFQDHFGSLLCRILRPEGFKPSNPPFLCEKLARKALAFNAEFIRKKTGAVYWYEQEA